MLHMNSKPNYMNLNDKSIDFEAETSLRYKNTPAENR